MASLDDAAALPLSSPVPPSLYGALAVALLAVGLLAANAFFVYEVTTSRFSRSAARELVTGGVASVFLGFGTLFALLATGVYV
eukprot:SM000006S19325  [mRNA]  locus=s6:74855:75486:+ [translate_table: standard]